MRIFTFVTSLILICLVSSCSYDLSRRVVQQGNLISEAKVSQLKPGMSKNQVAILMGNSLISPMFNNDRWDYAYTYRRGTGALLVKNVKLYFAGDVLKSIEKM